MERERIDRTLPSSRERLREAAKALFSERGYEPTSTATICRAAGTSESQVIKHFGGKQGLLEAIFEHAWEQINPAVRLATESVQSPREKLRILMEMVLTFLSRDLQLRTLFLLEGRRIRDDGRAVAFVPGFIEFVKTVDEIIKQLHERGELANNIHPEALRSALMGAIEGLLRDQLLATTSHFPATYSDRDVRTLCFTFLTAGLKDLNSTTTSGP
jgi:AcrR family transcriptional regulator